MARDVLLLLFFFKQSESLRPIALANAHTHTHTFWSTCRNRARCAQLDDDADNADDEDVAISKAWYKKAFRACEKRGYLIKDICWN